MSIFCEQDRVGYSEHALDFLKPRHPEDIGTVMPRSVNDQIVKVKWDRLREPQHFHQDFLKLIKPASTPVSGTEAVERASLEYLFTPYASPGHRGWR
jgi:hypothetical protein